MCVLEPTKSLRQKNETSRNEVQVKKKMLPRVYLAWLELCSPILMVTYVETESSQMR